MTEYQHQRTVMEWSCYASNRIRYPGLDLLYHVPNGGKRNQKEAFNLKRQGVRAGVPDLCLPVAHGQYHGLYIEMKAERGRVSENQKKWLKRLTEQGYLAKVCYGFDEAIRCIKEYYSYGE